MGKTYQKNARRAESGSPVGREAMAVPEQALVSLTEIAASAKEGLLALSVGVGLQVMHTLMDEDVTVLCGPRGKHNPDRVGYRHSSEDGSVTLGGRRVPVERPRVRAADGSGELALPSYEVFSSTDLPGEMVAERMLAGLSTRRYGVGLEPVGEQVERARRRRAGRRCRGGSLRRPRPHSRS